LGSEKQNSANKLNAQQSRGPRTPAGKAKVARNALKHGLTGREVVLPNEDPEEFESFRLDLWNTLDPHDALEGALSDNIVAYLWRLRRIPKFEATIYRRECELRLVRQAAAEVQQYEERPDISDLLVVERDRPLHKEAKQKLASASAKLDNPSFNVALVFETSPALSTLERRESALLRSLQKLLHELERLQAKRAGEHVPTPEIVDVDVNVFETSRADVHGTGANGETDEKSATTWEGQSGSLIENLQNEPICPRPPQKPDF